MDSYIKSPKSFLGLITIAAQRMVFTLLGKGCWPLSNKKARRL